MGKLEKNMNKWLIGLLLGGFMIGVLSKTKEGKSFRRRLREFFFGGIKQMKKDLS